MTLTYSKNPYDSSPLKLLDRNFAEAVETTLEQLDATIKTPVEKTPETYVNNRKIVRNAIQHAGGYVFSETPAGASILPPKGIPDKDTKAMLKCRAEQARYTSADIAINAQGLLDFIALTKGPVYVGHAFQEKLTVVFPEQTPDISKLELKATDTAHSLPIRPTYEWSTNFDIEYLDDKTNNYSGHLEREIKKMYKADVKVAVIFTADGFGGCQPADEQKLVEFARGTKPVAVTTADPGEGLALIFIQSKTILPQFKLVRPGIAIPGLVDIPATRIGKTINSSVEGSWNTKVAPLGGVTTSEQTKALKLLGQKTSPDKLESLAQLAVHKGNLEFAETFLVASKRRSLDL